MKRTTHSATRTRALAVTGIAVLTLTAVACNKKKEDTTPIPTVMPRVSITSVKGDAESELMAAIYARVLENAGVRVTRKDPISLDRAGYFQALQDGQFTMIPETSRDLLRFVIDNVEPSSSTTATTATTQPSQPATTRAPITIPTTTVAPSTTVPTTDTGAATSTSTDSGTSTTVATSTTEAGSTTTSTIPPTNGRSMVAQIIAINSTIPTTLLAYNGSLAEVRDVVACTNDTMKALSGFQLRNLTDLASLAPQVRLGASAAFIADEEEGLPQLEKVYAPEFETVVTVEHDGLAAAIDNGTADCYVLNSLDPLITTKGLTIIDDDQYFVPSNTIIVLMASTVNSPEVTAALDALSVALTTTRLNQMLNEITANGTDVAVVANAFADNL